MSTSFARALAWLGVGSFAVAAHIAVEIPEDLQFRRNDRVSAKDSATGEVGVETFEDDDVGGNDEGGLGVVVAGFNNGVEVLPGDGERHDLRLAASGRHLDAVAGEVVVLKEPEVRFFGDVVLQQVLVAAHSGHLEEVAGALPFQ